VEAADLQRRRIDVEPPLQGEARLLLHPIDLPKREHTLTDNTPRLVRVCVVANYLRGKHKS
jgi:hypothetical protein